MLFRSPLLHQPLAPNQLALAATLLRGNAAAVKQNGDQEDAILWLTSAAQALARAPHPVHSWMLPGTLNDAANRFLPRLPPPLASYLRRTASCLWAATPKRSASLQVKPPSNMFLRLCPSRALSDDLLACSEGFTQSLVIQDSMRRHDVQEALALHNISAAQRGRRVRNAGISIAYNVAVRPSRSRSAAATDRKSVV